MPLNEVEPEIGGAPAVRLGTKYEILFNRPLEELRSPNAAAYVAVNRERMTDQLFALVCNPDLPPRHEALDVLPGLHLDAVLTPIVSGVVDWPIAGRRAYGIIIDRPPSGRLVAALSQTIQPLSEDEIIRGVLPFMAQSLATLFSAGRTHRAINPTNLFFRNSATRQIVLGECVSAPPAATQPPQFETIESAMTSPAARGDGLPADDVYALGATLMFLLVGRDPVAEVSPERLLEDKIARGSYVALLGNARLPGKIIELIRGMIADDPRERWSLQDITVWLEGRRLVPKQFSFPKRAARPLEFNGLGYFTARSLAHAFAGDPGAAARLIKSPDFDIWIQRSLCDQDRSAALAVALSEGHDGGGGAQEGKLVARACIALDPGAPVRYNDFAAAVDGFGTAMAAAFLGKGSVQSVAQALAHRLPQFWFSCQQTLRTEHAAILKSYERLRIQLEDRRPGFGIERVLYELNPNLRCLSPLVERDYIIDPADLLRVLERVVASGQQTEDAIIDRHLAAFICARFRNAGIEWCDMLASPDPARRTLGALIVLSRLQSYRGPANVPALSERIAGQLPPLIERFHNRPRRKRVRTGIAQLAPKGNLGEMLALMENGSELRRDANDFTAASREFIAIERALAVLEKGAPARPEHAAEVGGRLSVKVANVLAWLVGLAAAVLSS